MKLRLFLVGCLASALLPVSAVGAIVFSTAIYVMNTDGSEVQKVVEVDGYTALRAPRWSPDGKHLVFSGLNEATGLRDCFVVATDGTGLRKVGSGDLPDWSPDGKQIVYQEHERQSGISVQNFDGQGTTHVADARSPRWSPDGSRLAMCSGNNFFVLDLLSGDRSTLLQNDVYDVFDGMDWSPDGKRLAVVVRPAPGGKRWLLLLDPEKTAGELVPRLQNGMGGLVSFSPDGRQLVFANEFRVYIVDVDGQAEPRLVPGQRGISLNPAFSPDGKRIAFASNRHLRDR